ncbi:hypothetical protein ASPBRDRAFT_48344 [Aspergillus brasiliensis CBS 101740]|uniref:Uncharacterized protein n=1 Tax=Aspergillus brasiliensis (strain CBS 101740 / IMI 381727 / IBT 21946) TaxID=767769 RepID=A0A1L9U579_ASPBC|nr:hypothetical protein ASPBRDRAFT_48344 [Aspergillus brasiliensis CBS 101740]
MASTSGVGSYSNPLKKFKYVPTCSIPSGLPYCATNWIAGWSSWANRVLEKPL